MLTILMIMVSAFIITYVTDREKLIGFAFFMSLIFGLVGAVIAEFLPKDTKLEVRTHKLQKIGDSYLNYVSEGYAVMYGNHMQILPIGSTEIKETKEESSIIIKETVREDTTWNYFTIDGGKTEYIIQLKTL